MIHAECVGVSGPGYYVAGPRRDVQDVSANAQPSHLPMSLNSQQVLAIPDLQYDLGFNNLLCTWWGYLGLLIRARA